MRAAHGKRRRDSRLLLYAAVHTNEKKKDTLIQFVSCPKLDYDFNTNKVRKF